KLEFMHFWKKRVPWRVDRPFGPDLVVHINDQPVSLVPTGNMRYLGFWLDPKLSFRSHVKFYASKAASTVSSISMLGNSVRGFTPAQKRQLYIAHVIPLMCYGAQ
ncbi:uncharacterized protein B0H18DRAFT_836382, partial [Fomitopsis serialis]|uniref:uncharacterized protein n=1 Tax=Fomitopsis serialis TaxID=139415 RepID=UPI002007ACD2